VTTETTTDYERTEAPKTRTEKPAEKMESYPDIITVGHQETVTLILLLVVGCPLFYLIASYFCWKKKGAKYKPLLS